MTYEVFYREGETKGSIIIEGDSIEEIRKNTQKELAAINATYMYSNWLNN